MLSKSKNVKVYIIAACIITCCYFSFWLGGTISPFIPFNSGLLGVLIAVLGIVFFPISNRRIVRIVFLSIIAVVIVFTGSRTGFLSWFTGVFILLLLYQHQFKYRAWKFLIPVVIIFSCLFTISAFLFKTDSTQGRWFIWQNCFAVIKQNLLTGAGWGQFRVAYNNQQANWFMQNGFHNKETMLADTVYYAFNEWLQLCVEIGLPLTIAILVFAFYVFIRAFKNVQKSGAPFANKKAVAAFAAIFFSSFFSYPFFYLPTVLLFVILFGYIIQIAKFNFIERLPALSKKILTGAVVASIAVFLIIQLYARLQWKDANELQRVGYKKMALQKMQRVYPFLKSNGDYLYALAGIYSSLNKTDSAIIFLQQAAHTKNDYELHRKLGQLYFETANYSNAEKYFLKAVYLVPNRFRSREMLVDFYSSTGNIEAARLWAEQTILLKEKVPSAITKRIKEKLKEMIFYSESN